MDLILASRSSTPSLLSALVALLVLLAGTSALPYHHCSP